MFLGVRAVIAKSFARIHRSNLINSGLLPLAFVYAADYDRIDQGDALQIEDVLERIETDTLTVRNLTKDFEFSVKHRMTEREINIILGGGRLNEIRKKLGCENA